MAFCLNGREPRRRDVDGFLEERPVERIGLVEDGEHAEAAVVEDSFHGELRAGNEPLNQDSVIGGIAHRLNLALRQQAGDALEGGDELFPIVSADHAAAPRQRERLQDAGRRHLGRQSRGIVGESKRRETRARSAVPRPMPIWRAACGSPRAQRRGGAPAIQAPRGPRRHHGRPIPDREEPVEGRRAGVGDDCLDRRVLVVEPNRMARSRHGSSSC